MCGPSGSGSAGLHAKTFAFDRRIGFIGSYNLDPRSSKLNTEMGVLFDCPELVKRLAEATGRDIDRYAYRVELVGNRLRWVTREGEKHLDALPRTGLGLGVEADSISSTSPVCLQTRTSRRSGTRSRPRFSAPPRRQDFKKLMELGFDKPGDVESCLGHYVGKLGT